MRVISHMSVLAPGCPQSTSHHYAFMPDLCGAGDVAVSFLSALQDRKQRVETTINLFFFGAVFLTHTEQPNVFVLGLD